MVRRLAAPTDVGDAAALPCSEQAGSIAGQSLAMDGGASPACPDLPLDLQRR
jgi:NAD(P)-dependent dehydrogenase (short-subunit alcohol dehydrogenase family)